MAETASHEPLSHKERTRARILDEAAQAMRTAGAEGIGVAALMKRAGLTHGGFYAHFASRDDLVAHAIDRMFEDSKAMLSRHLDQHEPEAGLVALIDHYLSDRARLAPERTCPLPSLASEAGRLPQAARARFAAGVERFQKAGAGALRARGRDAPEALAESVVAELVGAMSLARAVADEETARRMLASSRERLKERIGIRG